MQCIGVAARAGGNASGKMKITMDRDTNMKIAMTMIRRWLRRFVK